MGNAEWPAKDASEIGERVLELPCFGDPRIRTQKRIPRLCVHGPPPTHARGALEMRRQINAWVVIHLTSIDRSIDLLFLLGSMGVRDADCVGAYELSIPEVPRDCVVWALSLVAQRPFEIHRS